MTNQTPNPPLPQNRFATHHHHRLAYELIPLSSSQPPTIVLLHSLLPGRGEFTPLRDFLAGHARLILPDARGHGASAAIPDQRYTVAVAVSELEAILDDAGAPHVHLLGHDLGAVVALAFALAHPDRVRSLALVDPTLPFLLSDDPDPTVSALASDSLRLDALAAGTAYKGVTDRALDQYLTPRRGADWRSVTPRPLAAAFKRHATALAGTLSALSTYTPDPAALSTLTIPTLVSLTASPRPIVRATAGRLATLIPDARLITLPPPDPHPAGGAPPPPAPTPLAGDAASALASALLDALIRR